MPPSLQGAGDIGAKDRKQRVGRGGLELLGRWRRPSWFVMEAAPPASWLREPNLYHAASPSQEGAISSLKDWLIDSAIGSNPVPRLIAGIIFMQEQDYTRGCQAHTYQRNSGHYFQVNYTESKLKDYMTQIMIHSTSGLQTVFYTPIVASC
ncbi:coatomer subunit epsilon-2-like isoform X1 [Triticum dicoccoides]|uniref:coatomer subunit epsilon-2-like isoform X1 n=1 Tax=Triticum dicoccoides TaxID=85692 RepID=UPI00188E4A69|nr:coatomer subunit epsilon-2-like isoform X1 [Triticum dicoccoides]